MRLKQFQKDGVNTLLKGFSKHRIQCLAWYTGSGKTNVFSEMCKILTKDPNVKIGISSYMTIEVKEQVLERLHEFGLASKTHMVVSGQPVNLNKNIFVFNPQAVRLKPLDVSFDYFIIDEGHVGLDEECVLIAGVIKNMCNKDTKILIVSATPWDTLALKKFKNIPVYKRTLDQGLKDGLITDFRFHAEEAQLTFKEEDFTREGDLGRTAAVRQMAILKSACVGKIKNLINKYDKEIGDKCIVICPPGNFSEIARDLAIQFGGQAYTQRADLIDGGRHQHAEGQQEKLEKFKNDPKERFLFVVQKCQVGFDMLSLSSIIDLSITRNIKVLAQRCGRIARKNGDQKKHYFFVYDQSLMSDKLEWLVSTMIDFCLGAYDGWTTKTSKYRTVSLSQWSYHREKSILLSEVIKSLTDPAMIKNQISLAYVNNSPPIKWNLELALSEASKYSSRTEMWSKRPALYKWFRLKAKSEMDRIFPFKNHLGKWNEDTVLTCLKEHTGKMGRRAFLEKFGGIDYWLDIKAGRTRKQELLDKYFPLKYPLWTEERALRAMKTLKKWTEIRQTGGLRTWMIANGGEHKWKNKWLVNRYKILR